MNRATRGSLILAVLSAVAAVALHGAAADVATITFDGAVLGPDGSAVSGVAVTVFGGGGDVSTTTDAEGEFTAQVPAGRLSILLRAPLDLRLAIKLLDLGSHDASFSASIDLARGYLLSGTVVGPTGSALAAKWSLDVVPTSFSLPSGEALPVSTAIGTGRFGEVLPPGSYWIGVKDPGPYFSELVPVDLAGEDVVNADIRLHREPLDVMPPDPPTAELISVGAVDGLGEATVSGAAGAAMPHSVVLLVNVGSQHQAHTFAAADGSFSVKQFAPPGSQILVKHGPPQNLEAELKNGVGIKVTSMPGTFVLVPHGVTAGAGELPFAEVGALKWFTDDEPTTPNWISSAWAIEGTLKHGAGGVAVSGGTLTFSPGDPIFIAGTLRLYGPAIDDTIDATAVRVPGGLVLRRIGDEQGRMLPAEDYFMSTVLTPGGFPIQISETASLGGDGSLQAEPFQLAGAHCLEADFVVEGEVPEEAPPGLYQPRIWIDPANLPSSTEWLGARVFPMTSGPGEAPLPPIVVGLGSPPDPRRLVWWLLMEDFAQGQRGTGAREDRGFFALASQIVTQGARYVVPPVDARSGKALRYQLEPFLPTVAMVDRRVPSRPLVPLELPGGQLTVQIMRPDGTVRDLGTAAFARSLVRSRTTAAGLEINPGTTQLNEVYQLTTGDDSFRVSFDQFGHHEVRMTGTVEDIWGAQYEGGGTYDVWVAFPLDVDPGVLPGTPLEVGEAVSLPLQLHPRVPADVDVTLTLYPDSDPSRAIEKHFSGRANFFGQLATDVADLVASEPGEYRVDIAASYTASDGELFMGSLTWGGVVMTPLVQAQLQARGRRGLDALDQIPPSWFVLMRDLVIEQGKVAHSFNPYLPGDILWSRLEDPGGDALIVVASVFDTVGTITEDIRERAERVGVGLATPGTLTERIAAGELPLFLSSRSGLPAVLALNDLDQVAYSYRSSQRPGVRVREVVSTDGQTGGYWRLDTQYDEQAGVGFLGDQPNDFKLQFVGTVYRDLDSGYNEYGGQATGWVFIPPDDVLGSRVMPPYAGQGNGGWSTQGGPLLTLGGEAIDLFVVPTAVRPGTVLELGDAFAFSGYLMPPLDSSVQVTATSPGGGSWTIDGRASRVGYFTAPEDTFVVEEPGAWTVEVEAWHDGLCSGGATIPPYPQGSVLGSDDGSFEIYVVPPDAPRLVVAQPSPGFLSFPGDVEAVTVSGPLPAEIADPVLHYTIAMPGVIVEQGVTTPGGGEWSVVFDPTALQLDFPNLDLVGRAADRPGLSDTVSMSFLLTGTIDGAKVYRASTVTFQGEQVFVGGLRHAIGPPPRRTRGRAGH